MDPPISVELVTSVVLASERCEGTAICIEPDQSRSTFRCPHRAEKHCQYCSKNLCEECLYEHENAATSSCPGII